MEENTHDRLNLYGKLAKIYKEINKMPKKGYNAFHKYHYVQEADAVDYCRMLFNKHKVICLCACDDVIIQGELTIAKLRYIYIDTESGEKVELPWYGTGSDKLDKGLYKAYASGTKYQYLKSFMIPSDTEAEADDEGNKENGIKDDFVQSSPKSEQSTKREQSVHKSETTATCACGRDDYKHECMQADVIERVKNCTSTFEVNNWWNKHQREIAYKKQLSKPGVHTAVKDKLKELGKTEKKQEDIF